MSEGLLIEGSFLREIEGEDKKNDLRVVFRNANKGKRKGQSFRAASIML